jgi:hypothetical protein
MTWRIPRDDAAQYRKFWPSRPVEEVRPYYVDDLVRAILGSESNGH